MTLPSFVSSESSFILKEVPVDPPRNVEVPIEARAGNIDILLWKCSTLKKLKNWYESAKINLKRDSGTVGKQTQFI